MKTFNFTFNGYDELETFLSTHQIVDSSLLLIQFFDGSDIGVRAEIMNVSLRHS